jgi:2-polyprenyl-3-methyl-5-hydroxy-6-metoxy-1,4-benzoquinol methylase
MPKTDDYLQIHQYRLDYIYQQILKLNLPDSANILDVGCYPPYLFDKLSNQFNVFGISSPHEPISHPKIKIYDIESDELKFPQQFDLIIFTEIIEHLSNSISVLTKLSSLLASGGYLLITTPNVLRVHNYLNFILGRNIYFPIFQLEQSINFRHQREYMLNELPQLTSLKAFRLCHFVGYPPFRNKNKHDNIILKIGKYIVYYLQIIFPSHQDSLLAIFQK